eukprot:SAG25_NODE_1008_length_4323_cov_5.595206_4_plen_215_part_00
MTPPPNLVLPRGYGWSHGRIRGLRAARDSPHGQRLIAFSIAAMGDGQLPKIPWREFIGWIQREGYPLEIALDPRLTEEKYTYPSGRDAIRTRVRNGKVYTHNDSGNNRSQLIARTVSVMFKLLVDRCCTEHQDTCPYRTPLASSASYACPAHVAVIQGLRHIVRLPCRGGQPAHAQLRKRGRNGMGPHDRSREDKKGGAGVCIPDTYCSSPRPR